MYVMFCLPRHFDHSMSFFKVFFYTLIWNGSNDSLYLNVVGQAMDECLAHSGHSINVK